MRAWRTGVALLIASCLVTGRGEARPREVIETDPESGIVIETQPLFTPPSPNGCSPVRILIKNRSRLAGQWDLTFQSPEERFTNNRAQCVVSRFTARVEAGSEREFACLVPMLTVGNRSHYYSSALGLNVRGPGVRDSSRTFLSPSNRSGREIGSIGFSDKLISHQSTDLTAALKAKKFAETFSVTDPAKLPPDWRALSAYDQLWITATEWDTLPVGVRLAFEQWVATGGVLYRCGSDAPGADRKFGLGSMRSFPTGADGSLDIAKLVAKMGASGLPTLKESFDQYSTNWPDSKSIPPYSANAPLLISVIILFGIIVGPVNFFLFAGREKRIRIFWLTPLISVIGTVVICITIFVQDGFGGWGKRLALVVLQPERHSEILVQEQASKTGVLTTSLFHLDPAAMIRQLPTSGRSLRCTVDGSEYGGDWFQSRSVQGQLITEVRPTRAEIKLLNPEEVAAGKPPRILSRIAEQIDRAYFQTSSGAVFRAENVGPGSETTMRLIGIAEAKADLKKDFFALAGPCVKALAGFPDLEKECFYALSKKARTAMRPTLDQIRWNDDRVLYLCPAHVAP